MDIPIPSHGEPMRVSWGAAVAQSINALRSIGGDVLVTDTPQGSGDRSLPRNLRDRIKQPIPIPWTFACDITRDDNGYEVSRSGGWTNCRCQIGLDIDWGSADVKNMTVDWANLTDAAKDQLTSAHVILGTNLCADGIYFLYVELANKLVDHDAAKIVNSADPNYSSYQTDTTAGTFMIPIGTVENGSLSSGAPHLNPVIYKYL